MTDEEARIKALYSIMQSIEVSQRLCKSMTIVGQRFARKLLALPCQPNPRPLAPTSVRPGLFPRPCLLAWQNKLGGGEGVEGLYGSIKKGGMDRVLECMRQKCGLDARSVLVDVGAGLGR